MTFLGSAAIQFNPAPSLGAAGGVAVDAASEMPADADCLGVFVDSKGGLPAEFGLEREALAKAGFEGKRGQTFVSVRPGAQTVVAVGVGAPNEVTLAVLRDAAASMARGAHRHSHLVASLRRSPGGSPEGDAQAFIEGVVLARYSFDSLKSKVDAQPLTRITVVTEKGALEAVRRGLERGQITSRATALARDLANSPASTLTATRMGKIATEVAERSGLDIELFDGKQLSEMGCGGILGVNAGSTEPPCLIKLSYRPKDANGKPLQPTGHLALIGKGIMYDSGGISLKPNDMTHAAMKLDMSGAAAILASMSSLKALGCKASVTGFLCCTDNMPSGSAMRLGDVLTVRGGTTVEVLNTDAEGRLVMADGMILATEEKPDALVDIATLTGACLRALGEGMAGAFGNNAALISQVEDSAERTDEPVWELPVDRRYRKQLDSTVADLRNVGDDNPGAITAALFLAEFTRGLPWVHLDICGPMKVDADDGWRPKGATGFGTRLLADLAMNFAKPASAAPAA